MSRRVNKPQSTTAAEALVNTHLPDTGTRTVTLTPASSVKVRPVRWLLNNQIALGTLALLAGREGIGKSLVAYTYAAQITTGTMPGQYVGKPRAVIVAATEDSWSSTIVPRLMAASADLDLVYRADVTTSEGVDTGLVLPRDLTALENEVAASSAAMVLLDPLMSRLDAGLDTHRDSEVRLALEPLVALADRTGAAVLGIIHVNKSSNTDALTTVMASKAFVAVARSVLFVMVDPDDDDVRLLGQPKNNLGITDAATLTFTIASEKVADTPEGPVWTGKVVWGEGRLQSIRDTLESAQQSSENRTATEDAAEWITEYLTAQGGTAESKTIKAAARAAGYSLTTLGRARKRAGVVAERAREFQSASCWSLPGQDAQSDHVPSRTIPGESGLSELSETSRAVGPLDPLIPVDSDPPRTRATPAHIEVPGRAAPSSPEKARKSSPPTPPPRKRRKVTRPKSAGKSTPNPKRS